MLATMHISNRAFSGLRNFSITSPHGQIKVWLLRMKKLKIKCNILAQCKPESLSLSTALLTIY